MLELTYRTEISTSETYLRRWLGGPSMPRDCIQGKGELCESRMLGESKARRIGGRVTGFPRSCWNGEGDG